MDNSYSYQNVLKKIKDGVPVDWNDVACVVGNNEDDLMRYISDNDYKQVYKLLHQSDANLVIGKNASFIPNIDRTKGELKLLLAKKDYSTLNDVLENFVINTSSDTWTSDLGMLNALISQGIIYDSGNGYKFNIELK